MPKVTPYAVSLLIQIGLTFFLHELVNKLPFGGATPDSTGNEGVVYDEITGSARQQGKIGDTAAATRRPGSIELKANAAYGPGNIELKANAAYQVGMNKH